jgi:hypothetical protein
MGKISWNTSASQIDNYEDDGSGGFYDGPVPPPSIYRFRLAEVKHMTFSTGSQGLRLTLEIDDPRAEKARYKGARAWENVVDGESTTFKIKQFLLSIGATGKDWANTQVGADGIVTKIGRIRITDDMYVRAQTKLGKNANSGEPRMEIGRLLPMSTEDGDGEDDNNNGDDSEPAPF